MQKKEAQLRKNIVELLLFLMLLGIILLAAANYFSISKKEKGKISKEYFIGLVENINNSLDKLSQTPYVLYLEDGWIIKGFDEGNRIKSCKGKACLCVCTLAGIKATKFNPDCEQAGLCRVISKKIRMKKEDSFEPVLITSGFHDIYAELKENKIILSTEPLFTESGQALTKSKAPSKFVIAQKIISTAKKLELTKEQQKLVLKVAKQESGIRHCKDGSLNCTEEGVLCGDNGDSCGVFQISRKSHPDAYNPELNPSPECEGKTAYDLDCNIYWGVRILKNYFDEYKGKTGYYKCKDVYYSDEDAALRRYNGWPSTCAGDPDYVENVKGQDISELLSLLT